MVAAVVVEVVEVVEVVNTLKNSHMYLYGLCTVHAVFANVMSLNLQVVKDN